MIIESIGSIFDSDAEILVNPVNCVGVMGKGLALEFKRRYPDYFADYRSKCSKNLLSLGVVSDHNVYHSSVFLKIVSFPTKHHWRDVSSLSSIEKGLSGLAAIVAAYDIQSIAIPALGCGLGQLDWKDVKPAIVSAFESQPRFVDVFLYPPR